MTFNAMAGFGKVPPRPPGGWLERQQAAQRFSKTGWLRRRLQRAMTLSTSTLALVVAATSAISAAATVVMFGNFSAGMRGASVEQLVLRRLLVDTSQEQLARVCSSITRLGGGASSDRGWNVCLDSPLGKRWLKAGKTANGGHARWRTVGAVGDARVGRTPVPCRAVSVGMGVDAAYVMELALEHDCEVDVFDLGLDIYTNHFESPEAGWQGRVKFHSRGLHERDGTVSAPHVKRLQLLRWNGTSWADASSLHPGYDTLAQGPGWALEGHSGAEWRLGSKPFSPLRSYASSPSSPGTEAGGAARESGTDSLRPDARPVHTLESLLLRSGPFLVVHLSGLVCICLVSSCGVSLSV